ncbi:hypothetical protein B0H13DRAFT_1905658 [Mycena leptocephala]|nr:hypothetical protein B0H13DRAFT_1905658 [Mycena leptocephala]
MFGTSSRAKESFNTRMGEIRGAFPRDSLRTQKPRLEVGYKWMSFIIIPSPPPSLVDSLATLAKLCPFFLKQLTIAGEDWLEISPPSAGSTEGSSSRSPSKKRQVPGRPGGVIDSAEVLVTRSPRRVTGGLHKVRKIIHWELELRA